MSNGTGTVTIAEYQGTDKSTWCAGCGDFPILKCIKETLVKLEIPPHRVVVTSGIGCGSKLPHYMRINTYNSLHGRALPVAMGLKLANHKLRIISITGDGDGYGIGGNHFIHTARRNPDITHIVENNQVYGLTKGQYSPTSDLGYMTTTSPEGAIEAAINPIALAIAAGATFVARASAGNPKHMIEVLMKAIEHKGYSLVDILQPCVTYNKKNTYAWYKERAYVVNEDAGYDPHDKQAAFAKAHEWEDKIPIGIIYQEEGRPTYEDQVTVLKKGTLLEQGFKGRTKDDLEPIKQGFV